MSVFCWLGLACQADVPPDAAYLLASWGDIPVPRDFVVVEWDAERIPMQAGEYRAGDFVLEGRGSPLAIERYYQERLPLHGWQKDESSNLWHKSDQSLEYSVKHLHEGTYGNPKDFAQVRLSVRTTRNP